MNGNSCVTLACDFHLKLLPVESVGTANWGDTAESESALAISQPFIQFYPTRHCTGRIDIGHGRRNAFMSYGTCRGHSLDLQQG